MCLRCLRPRTLRPAYAPRHGLLETGPGRQTRLRGPESLQPNCQVDVAGALDGHITFGHGPASIY